MSYLQGMEAVTEFPKRIDRTSCSLRVAKMSEDRCSLDNRLEGQFRLMIHHIVQPLANHNGSSLLPNVDLRIKTEN